MRLQLKQEPSLKLSIAKITTLLVDADLTAETRTTLTPSAGHRVHIDDFSYLEDLADMQHILHRDVIFPKSPETHIAPVAADSSWVIRTRDGKICQGQPFTDPQRPADRGVRGAGKMPAMVFRHPLDLAKMQHRWYCIEVKDETDCLLKALIKIGTKCRIPWDNFFETDSKRLQDVGITKSDKKELVVIIRQMTNRIPSGVSVTLTPLVQSVYLHTSEEENGEVELSTISNILNESNWNIQGRTGRLKLQEAGFKAGIKAKMPFSTSPVGTIRSSARGCVVTLSNKVRNVQLKSDIPFFVKSVTRTAKTTTIICEKPFKAREKRRPHMGTELKDPSVDDDIFEAADWSLGRGRMTCDIDEVQAALKAKQAELAESEDEENPRLAQEVHNLEGIAEALARNKKNRGAVKKGIEKDLKYKYVFHHDGDQNAGRFKDPTSPPSSAVVPKKLPPPAQRATRPLVVRFKVLPR
ncbi:MAG: hypothetical protein KVP17_005354 [Porospora cf. gigantea B]|uniref:uncharacterized protein n=1 Tax=Porospora cf. gigantea B TaxID=2853592 RepID=UPI003571FB0B|nr:MAG: hypothetical protein KVP17_005354 [Porospora cf. gigantea B]